MTPATTETPEARHPFLRLAAPPYRVIGFRIVKFGSRAGTSCDYCGTAIAETYDIQGADGRTFKVGNECVRKSSRDVTLIAQVKVLANAAARKDRAAKSTERRATILAWLAGPERAKIAAVPHPRGFSDRRTGQPLDLGDWATWMLAHGGMAATDKVWKALRPVVED